MFYKKTIKDIKLNGKTVLVSVDYNVPGDAAGKVTEDYRIRQSLPTLEYLLRQKCAVVLISHRGRPNGKPNPALSLKPAAAVLEKLIKKPVQFIPDCVGPSALSAKQALKPGQILLLENTRFHEAEERNEPAFAKQLAEGIDVFVQEAFGNAHRSHASTVGVAKYVPAVAGLLLAKEVDTITEAMEKPQRPLISVIGGAKIADKIEVLNRLIDIADFVAVGGAMANTFLLSEGIEVGKSVVEKDDVPLAKEILRRAKAKAAKQPFIFYLPQDGVVATHLDKTAPTRIVDWDAHVIADVENYPKKPPGRASKILANELILDIGPFSGAFIAGAIQLAQTVVWNGALGVTETPPLAGTGPVGPFAHGTDLLIDALTGLFGHKPFSVVGGGDTVGYIQARGQIDAFNHVSTGGGASLELLAGKKLPAVEALQKA